MTFAADDDPKPESMQAYARRRIEAAIATGTIPPGSRLSPHLLAPELGLSHIPIREALAGLAASGFVDYARGRGYVSRALSSHDLADLFHWRAVLEREAYLVAVPKLTDGDIAEMARLAGLMGAHTSSAERAEYLRLNREFHFVTFKRAGSDRLLRFLNYLWDQQAPYVSLALPASAQSHAENVAVIPLFASRDVDSVIAAMDEHRRARLSQVAAWESADDANVVAHAAAAADGAPPEGRSSAGKTPRRRGRARENMPRSEE
jgi:DNA-binding GntR family transcriptional regulator